MVKYRLHLIHKLLVFTDTDLRRFVLSGYLENEECERLDSEFYLEDNRMGKRRSRPVSMHA